MAEAADSDSDDDVHDGLLWVLSVGTPTMASLQAMSTIVLKFVVVFKLSKECSLVA